MIQSMKAYTCQFLFLILLVLLIATVVTGWKAVPASQAMYSLRGPKYYPPQNESALTEDELAPRTFIHSIYKFGWCTRDSIQRVYLRKETNITLSDYQSTQANYIYLIEDGETRNFPVECLVMKIMVPHNHMFRRTRVPFFYCQGELRFVWKLTYTLLDIHEFYMYDALNMPANFVFEFYHPHPL